MISEELTLFADWSILCSCPEMIDEIRAGEISLKLRRLLLDGNSLLNFVNKKFKVKVEFPIQSFLAIEMGNGVKIYGLGDLNIGNRTLQNRAAKLVRLEKYLKHVILEINDEKLTVKDVINLVANQLGGVHFDAIKAQKVVKFDPRSPLNSLALRRAVVKIAKVVCIGLKELATRCSPFPSYDDFIGHYDAGHKGVIGFDRDHWMEVEYREPVQCNSITATAVLELGLQEIPEAVFLSMQNQDAEVFKLSFTPIGDAILDVRWAENNARIVWEDKKRVRPIGKNIFVCVLMKRIGNRVKLGLEINGIKMTKIIEAAAHDVKLTRSVIGADISGGNGASFRLKELCLLKGADDLCLDAIKKYSIYRYNLR